MPKKTGGLQQLLLEELQDLLDAEKQLVKALPNIAKSVSDSELQQLFRNHLETTKLQVQRLEEVFESMDTPARGKPCKAMKGMVEESRDIIQEHEKQLLNSALAGSARKVEHYEIAAYESAQSLAQELGLTEAVQRLQATLKEEVETERRFSEISKRLLKESSSMAEEGEMEESVESEGRQPRRRGDGAQASSRASSGASNRRSSSRASKARPSAKTSQTTASGRSSAKSASSGRSSSGRSASSGRAKASAGGRSAASAHPLTDHEEIREWAEQRKAQPACVRGTGGSEDIGMIRLDFPGYSGQESLEPISWDDWFEKFDERGLALIVQDKTSGGQKSNFNKLVSREGLERPKTRSAH